MVRSIVGRAADLGPGTLREVKLDGEIYAIANVDGTLFAIDGICGHAGGNLGSGKLIGATVKCPRHGSVYDLKTGKNLKKPFIPLAKAADRQVFAIMVEGENVIMDV